MNDGKQSYFKAGVPKSALALQIRHAISQLFDGSLNMFTQRLLEASAGVKADELYSFNTYIGAGSSINGPSWCNVHIGRQVAFGRGGSCPRC